MWVDIFKIPTMNQCYLLLLIPTHICCTTINSQRKSMLVNNIIDHVSNMLTYRDLNFFVFQNISKYLYFIHQFSFTNKLHLSRFHPKCCFTLLQQFSFRKNLKDFYLLSSGFCFVKNLAIHSSISNNCIIEITFLVFILFFIKNSFLKQYFIKNIFVEKYSNKTQIILFIFFFIQTFEIYDTTNQTLIIKTLKEYQDRNYNKNAVHVVIYDGVEELDSSAFYEWPNLLSVNIGNSVTLIGTQAFSTCTYLETVTIGNNVKTIGTQAFYLCIGLETINFGKNITSIGRSAFYSCSSLITITIPCLVTVIENNLCEECTCLEIVNFGENVTTIKSSAFQSCTSIKNITVPKSVKLIEAGAFTGCHHIFFTISTENEHYSESNGILYNKNKTTLICYPDKIHSNKFEIPNYVTTIGSFAFYDSSFINITIPNSITIIENFAFQSSKYLETLYIGENVALIGNFAFSDCIHLRCVYFIGYNEPNVSAGAFYQVDIKIVMTSHQYQSSKFGLLNVLKGTTFDECIQYPWPTDTFTFTASNTFTKSKSFTESNQLEYSSNSLIYTKSNTFEFSNIDSNFSYVLTCTLSYTRSFTISVYLSNSLSLTIINSKTTFIFYERSYFFYSISYYPSYYILYSLISFNNNQSNNTINKGVLSGIICGAVILVLLIIGIIILVFRNTKGKISNVTEFVSSSSGEAVHLNKEVSEFVHNDADNWLVSK